MTYVVTENCIRCLHTDCVDVCPSDCFHIGAEMLVIDPATCIDCGICEPECPADAIRPDTDPDSHAWLEFNAKWALHWPLILAKRPAPKDAGVRDGEAGKFALYFTGTAGVGD